MKQLLTTTVLALLVFMACKKDDKKEFSTVDLTNGRWHMTAKTTKFTEAGQTTTQDDFLNMPACEKDDTLKFGTDNKITKDKGATKCYQSEPQTEQKETWELTENGAKLSFKSNTPGGYVNTYDVAELNPTTLHLREHDTDGTLTIIRDYIYAH